MYIEILHPTPKHPNVGERYDERVSTALYLVDQGYAREATRELPPVEVNWSVVQDELRGTVCIVAKCNRDHCGGYRFFGDPALLSQARYSYHHGCLEPPTPPPANIVRAYEEQRNFAAAHPVPREKSDGMSYADAEALSRREAKRLDGQKLDQQIAWERQQKKALGY